MALPAKTCDTPKELDSESPFAHSGIKLKQLALHLCKSGKVGQQTP